MSSRYEILINNDVSPCLLSHIPDCSHSKSFYDTCPVARMSVFGISDQVLQKPGFTDTKDIWRLAMSAL